MISRKNNNLIGVDSGAFILWKNALDNCVSSFVLLSLLYSVSFTFTHLLISARQNQIQPEAWRKIEGKYIRCMDDNLEGGKKVLKTLCSSFWCTTYMPNFAYTYYAQMQISKFKSTKKCCIWKITPRFFNHLLILHIKWVM